MYEEDFNELDLQDIPDFFAPDFFYDFFFAFRLFCNYLIFMEFDLKFGNEVYRDDQVELDNNWGFYGKDLSNFYYDPVVFEDEDEDEDGDIYEREKKKAQKAFDAR